MESDSMQHETKLSIKQNFHYLKLLPGSGIDTADPINNLADRPLLSLCSKMHEHHQPTNPEQKHEPINLPPGQFLFASISTSKEATGELFRIISTCYSVLYYGLASGFAGLPPSDVPYAGQLLCQSSTGLILILRTTVQPTEGTKDWNDTGVNRTISGPCVLWYLIPRTSSTLIAP